MIEELKKTLPNFPEEVLEEWLLPYAKTEGWPPFGRAGLPVGPRWPYLLGKKPLPYWLGLQWSEHLMHVEPERLTPQCTDSIAQMMLAAFMGEMNMYSQQIPDMLPRIERILSYVKSNQALPKPPALIATDAGFKVVDGNHRMAVYFAVRMYRKASSGEGVDLPPQRFWVAE